MSLRPKSTQALSDHQRRAGAPVGDTSRPPGDAAPPIQARSSYNLAVSEHSTDATGQVPSGQQLVDVEKGLISREIFVNRDVYEMELERVFARSWLFVGHESQIARPGDFILSRMGEESVILQAHWQQTAAAQARM